MRKFRSQTFCYPFPWLKIMCKMTLSLVHCLIIMTLMSCYSHGMQTSDAWDTTDINDSDSVSFFTTHHYTQNYNFIVTADSLHLQCQQPDELPFDTVFVLSGDYVVVADIMTLSLDSIDSIWVKVARDQFTQGWLRERKLLESVSPAQPISRFIDIFSDVHLLIFLSFAIVVCAIYGIRFLRRKQAYIVHLHDIPSFYPSLLAVLVASSATLYASIQLFASESWRHYYYHPTLNPFDLPLHLGIFVACVWAIIIVLGAVLDDIYRRLSFSEAIFYLCGLCAVCAVNYILFSVLTLYYIGYPLLVAYICYAIWAYRRQQIPRFICGNCDSPLSSKGRCPHCGAENE